MKVIFKDWLIVLSISLIMFYGFGLFIKSTIPDNQQNQSQQDQIHQKAKNKFDNEYHGVVVDNAAGKDGYILFIKAGGKTKGFEVTKEQFLEYPVQEEVIIKVFKDELMSITADNDSKE